MALRFLQAARSRVAQGHRGFSSAAAAPAEQTARATLNLQQSEAEDPRISSFKYFNQKGGKFRVTVVNRCNFNCFFCHNEGMDNPREPGALLRPPTSPPTGAPPGKPGFPAKGCGDESTERLLELINTYTRMGGKSLNISGTPATPCKPTLGIPPRFLCSPVI